MIRLIFILVPLLFHLASQGQTINVKDTLDVYLADGIRSGGTFPVINGRLVSKRKYEMIEKLDSIYDNSIGAIHFVRFRNLNGKIKYTHLDLGPDMGGPFGEYNEYYDNGRLKVHGFYTMPTDSISGNSEIDSTWTYYRKNGKVLGFKNYKNGLANGKWKYFDKRRRVSIEKEFRNGFSYGQWTKWTHVDKSYSFGQTSSFYNGFNQSLSYNEIYFDTELDKKENIYSNRDYREIEKIDQEYVKDSLSIQNTIYYNNTGKFYILRDGIIVCLKEFKDGVLISKVEYDFR